jgi:alpha-1,2-mannosyltransferase
VAIMAQLCRAPLPIAVAVWWAFSFVCLFGAIVLIARAVAPGQAVALASLVLVTQAAYSNLRLGQVAWPLMLLVTAAWLADRSRRPLRCGILLGIAASWKPFLLVFVPYLIWRREWRALVAMAGTVVVTGVIGLVAVGAGGYASWFASLRLVGWAGHPLNASLRGMISRALAMPALLEQHTTPIVAAPQWLDAVWVAISMIVAAITIVRVVVRHDIDAGWAGLALLALLVSPLGWVHYVPIATGPLVAAVLDGRRPALRPAVVGWLLLCVPFAWLKAATFGPVLTLTVASAYGWGTLLLLAAALRSAKTGRSPSASME